MPAMYLDFQPLERQENRAEQLVSWGWDLSRFIPGSTESCCVTASGHSSMSALVRHSMGAGSFYLSGATQFRQKMDFAAASISRA